MPANDPAIAKLSKYVPPIHRNIEIGYCGFGRDSAADTGVAQCRKPFRWTDPGTAFCPTSRDRLFPKGENRLHAINAQRSARLAGPATPYARPSVRTRCT